MEKTTEALFTYAGHTMAIKLTECPDVHIETVSISSREVYEDGENLGVYPKYFAECEAIDIITDRITNKDAGATIDGTESIVRGVIRELINEGILQTSGTRQDIINELYKMGATSQEIRQLLEKVNN